MADHFVAINRGVPGVMYTDFTTGTSSTSSTDVELRVADGKSLTIKDIQLALEAFERFFATRDLLVAAGIVFSD